LSVEHLALGVRDVYIAEATMTGGVLSYGTPRLISSAANVAIALTKAPTQHRESGHLVYNSTHVTEAKVTVQTAVLSDAEKMRLYYSLAAAQSGNRYSVGKATDQSLRVAIGFYVKLKTGYRCWWFMNATAAPSDETYGTETESGPQIQTDSVEFTCITEDDEVQIFDCEIVADKTAVTTFFSAVTSAAPKVNVGAVVYKVTAPVKSATPQSTHDAGTGYTAAIAFAPVDATFDAETVYTATVTYTAATGYVFPDGFGATDVQGLPASGTTAQTVTRVSATSVTIVVVYVATAA